MMGEHVIGNLANAVRNITVSRKRALALIGGAMAVVEGQRVRAQGCLPNRERCQTGADCCSGRCVRHNNGKTCRRADNQGICTVEQDLCGRGDNRDCGPEDDVCKCFVTTTGRSFCGHRIGPTFSCDCTSNKQCQQRHGKGARCIDVSGCNSCAPSGTGCMAPCPNLITPE